MSAFHRRLTGGARRAVLVAVLALTAAAPAQAGGPEPEPLPVRDRRPITLGFDIDAISVRDAEGSGAPAIHLGYNPSPRFELNATFGAIPAEHLSVILYGAGARFYFLHGRLSPYAAVRGVVADVEFDEGRPTHHKVIGAGLGLAASANGGFDIHLEVLPAASYVDEFYSKGWHPGVLMSLGVGYRVAVPRGPSPPDVPNNWSP